MRSLLNRKVFTSILFLGLFSVLFIFPHIVFTQEINSIQSTAQGGNWNNPSTWVGDIIPIDADSVEINAPVVLDKRGPVMQNIQVIF